MKNLLEIKNLNLSFRLEDFDAKAIHGISLNVEKGEALGIVGESGCGKSMTAMSVMRLLPSNAIIGQGEIIYKGQDLLKLSEKQMQKIRGNQIVLIPQDPMTSLNPLYTVGDQIMEVIELHQGVSRKEAKKIAIETLKSVKIPEAEERINDYPHQFSGGMRQRVIIAMALCCNPELIIADEPTTALDVTVQAQILNLIKSIQEEKGTSLILITHDLGVVAEVCDYIAVMYAGRIVEYGDVESVFANPSHPYTVGLMNSLPNLNNGRLQTIKGQPPGITEIITGCSFAPRCLSKKEICKNQEPVLKQKDDNHLISCFIDF